jgi:uncharacterized protein (DUF1778 family)
MKHSRAPGSREAAAGDTRPGDRNSGKDRMDFRIDAEQKELIARAAMYSGETLTGYAVSTLVREARRVIREHEITMLSDVDRDRFLRMLNSPPAVPDALRRAVRRKSEVIARSE